MQQEPGMAPTDTLLAVTTLSFDIAGLELYLPLVTGAKVVIASREDVIDGARLLALTEQHQVSVLQATPVTWRAMLEAGWQGTPRLKALVGGEAFPPELAAQLVPRVGELWNMYGPTETTIWSSIYRVTVDTSGTVPIGKPIANTTLYVLDAAKQPVPIGVPGELYIGGDGVGRGYRNRPELTAERFLADPFRPGDRVYRTGDQVKLLADGSVQYLGRLDFQVKVRGFRIELGEIETVLGRHPAVQECIVSVREDIPGDKRLVGYVAADGATPSELRAWVKERLPDYMVPSAIVKLGQFPLTPNGKIDRKNLPAPTSEDYQAGREYVAPRDGAERKLAGLWEEILGVRPVGIKETFWDLGGRSLLAARLFLRIARQFGKELPLSTLFHAPTVEQLALQLRPAAAPVKSATVVAIREGGANPPFFCVHGGAGSTLFLHRLAQSLPVNQPFYGIEPEGLDGSRFRYQTIEQMAAHYLSEIKKIQPAGPYYLGGYCFGGLVAFEMAQQLWRAQDPAALVILFTAELRFHRLCPAPRVGKPPAKSMSERLARLSTSPWQSLAWRWNAVRGSVAETRKKIVTGCAMRTYRMLFALGRKVPPGMRTMYVVRILNRAERQYRPKPYPGKVVLFHGSGIPKNDFNMGWDGLAAQIEHRVIGNVRHRDRRDLMEEPLVQHTARELTVCIESALAGIAGAANHLKKESR
jgi:thioesterase domain-containing protein